MVYICAITWLILVSIEDDVKKDGVAFFLFFFGKMQE